MSVNRQLRSSRSVVGPYNVVLLHHMYNYFFLGGGGIFRELDVYPGDPGSNPIRDVDFFFKTTHHFLFTNLYIHMEIS